MNLFKKKESNCCQTNSTCCSPMKEGNLSINDQDKRIIVLGACCGNSVQTFENVKTAVKILELPIEVENIGHFEEIAAFGVMSTPALVVNNKVYSQGRKISVVDAKKFIEKALES